ncbi:MAG: DNA adenine methylase [Alphaproteobacteria bacterium]|jgi:DNA adenine methylase
MGNLSAVGKKESTFLTAAPVLKWAGGKGQLLPVLNQNYPKELINNRIDTYIEPFVGGGAVFFDIANQFTFKRAYLFDVNPELIILYNVIKDSAEELITLLTTLSEKFFRLDSEGREAFFYTMREQYNAGSKGSSAKYLLTRAAHTIFLNRTCFNGLFRVNSKGHFNVPYGKYRNPNIVMSDRLRAASYALSKAIIKQADFAESAKYIEGNTFIYYDPPYRPLNLTSSFNSYAKDSFDDREQARLADTYNVLDKKGVLQLLSNSDPTNYTEDPFFDDLYSGHSIQRVDAKRMINADASKRGSLREILVRNY